MSRANQIHFGRVSVFEVDNVIKRRWSYLSRRSICYHALQPSKRLCNPFLVGTRYCPDKSPLERWRTLTVSCTMLVMQPYCTFYAFSYFNSNTRSFRSNVTPRQKLDQSVRKSNNTNEVKVMALHCFVCTIPFYDPLNELACRYNQCHSIIRAFPFSMNLMSRISITCVFLTVVFLFRFHATAAD
jgi:hypothetical protein